MDFLRQIFQTSPTFIKIGFEDIKIAIEKIKYTSTDYILINTMPNHFQNILISGTLTSIQEESEINRILDNYEMSRVKIILYGLNSTDETVEKKAQQLQSLGFSEIYIYWGGMFEWALLHELYGPGEFPTTGLLKSVDILKYRPDKKLDIPRIGY